MAITQQLARVDAALLARCREDVRALDAVCSFESLEESEYLDLDWAPGALAAAATGADVSATHRRALTLATAGGEEVNPAYRDEPDSIFEHPVAFLPAAIVADVAAALDELVATGFPTEEQAARTHRTAAWAELLEARAYLSEHVRNLARFYREATQRGLCVMMWWD